MASDMPAVADVVGRYLRGNNINVPYLPYFTKIQQFLSWYRGKTDWHSYRVWNGIKRVKRERLTLDMAKTVCEDLANLIINEKLDITANDKAAEQIINKVLDENNFRVNASQLVELMFALGTGAFVESLQDGKVVVDYIHGDLIFPLKWDNGEITECAFAIVGGDNERVAYTLITHKLDEAGNYVIEKVNLDVNGSVVRLSEIENELRKVEDNDIERWETGSPVPLFQIIRTNIVNNYDKTNPLGMSCYGNAIDILKAIDETYDSLNNEFALGKKRIFIKSNLKAVRFPDDLAGQGLAKTSIYNQIDSNDVMFYQIDWAGEHEDKPPIYESNLTLRVNEHQQAIDTLMKLLSRKCGLGDNFYSFTGENVTRTATEIVSVNSALFRNIKKQELVITQAIKGLCKAILTLYGVNSEQDITINYDDSIIEDAEKEKTQAMSEYNAGLIDRVEYFVLTRKMTREQALKFCAEMDATDTMKDVSGLMGGFGAIS